MMKKLIATLLCMSMIATCFAACGKQTASYNIADVASAIEAVADIANPLEFTEDDIIYDMSIDMAMVEEFTGHRTGTNGAAGAVLVMKTVAGETETVKAQLEAYKVNTAAFLANYPEFATAQAQAEEGRIVMKGDYLVLAIASEDADYSAVDEAIDKALK